MNCVICGTSTEIIMDLGNTPPANSLLDSISINEKSFPLVLELCSNSNCSGIQLRDHLDSKDLYRNYFYVTPNSPMLLGHYAYLYEYLKAGEYINNQSFVLEVGSNIGYFLEYIKDKVGRVLGIDPAENIVKMAIENGIDTVCDFFNEESASTIKKEHGVVDLIVARHCFAHNSDPHQLMAAVSEALSDDGCVVIENAYVINTIQNNEFDQVYHEHMLYYSIRSMQNLLKIHGLVIVDVTMSLIHGGSVVFIAKRINSSPKINKSVAEHLAYEEAYLDRTALKNFTKKAISIKEELRTIIKGLGENGRLIYTYGATAKGNTLLNYIGVTSSQIPYCVDNTKIKIGKFLPKSHIEVISEERGLLNPPDYFLLTAWNYKDEIIKKVRNSGNHHSKFIVPFPFVHIV